MIFIIERSVDSQCQSEEYIQTSGRWILHAVEIQKNAFIPEKESAGMTNIFHFSVGCQLSKKYFDALP